MRGRALFHIMRADFLERTRRFSFLVVLVVTLICAALLVPPTTANYASLVFDHHRGVYNAAWIGMAVAFSITLFLSFIGFYLVKNTIERDEQTGVGQILAATPLTKAEYLIGKMLSNFLVLASIVLLTVLVLPILLLQRGEDRTIDLWNLVSPFLFISLPAMVLTAAFAVCFEVIPGLKGGLGNIAYFFLWSLIWLLSVTICRRMGRVGHFFDPMGMASPIFSLQSAAKHEYPNINLENLGIGFRYNLTPKVPFSVFHFTKMTWTWLEGGGRLLWLALAAGLVLLLSGFFHRFDPQKKHSSIEKPKRFWRFFTTVSISSVLAYFRSKDSSLPTTTSQTDATVSPDMKVSLTPLLISKFQSRYGAMLVAELKLLLKGVNVWWYLVAIGLIIATLVTPLRIVRAYLLPGVGIWPLLLWSSLGTKEQQYQTHQLIFTTPHPLLRQFTMTWLAGVLLTLLMTSSMMIRFLLGGDTTSALLLLIASLLIPSLALMLGTCTNTSKFFEIFYFLLWYIGPFQKVHVLDFLGATPPEHRTLFLWAGLTIIFLLFAFLGRKRQLRI